MDYNNDYRRLFNWILGILIVITVLWCMHQPSDPDGEYCSNTAGVVMC